MGFFDDLTTAAIEKVKEKVKEELAELGIDLDEDDADEAPEPEPEEIAAEEASSTPAQDDDGGERPVSAWSTPLNVTTSLPPSAPAVACSNYSPSTTSFPRPDADTTFNEAVQKLWDLDARLIPNQDYKIDVQSSKHPCNKEDAAEEPLFTYVKPAVFRKRPTFTTFVALLNNYSTYTGEEEDVTEQELQENRAFLNEVMKTAPMKYCHQYCIVLPRVVRTRGRRFLVASLSLSKSSTPFGLNCTVVQEDVIWIHLVSSMYLLGKSRMVKSRDFTIGSCSIWKKREETLIFEDISNQNAEVHLQLKLMMTIQC